MDKFVITGGKPLHGTVAISGAKNSALPAMAASLLTAERLALHNVAMVRDIITMGKLLAYMGASVTTSEFPAADYSFQAHTISDAEKMGAEIATSHGYIEARAPKGGRLKGGHVVFEKITVTGTENILMAATLADGETILENSAREPEVTDLIVLLRKMGARISGDETSTLRVQGVAALHGAEHFGGIPRLCH